MNGCIYRIPNEIMDHPYTFSLRHFSEKEEITETKDKKSETKEQEMQTPKC